MRNLISLLIVIICFVGCASCEYKPDVAINNAQAGDPSFPVIIQAKNINEICKDSQGKVGLCSFRVYRDSDPGITIKVIERPYSYNFKMSCADQLGFPPIDYPVVKDKPYSVTIPNKLFVNIEKTFTCNGELYPNDRETASILFRFHISLVKADFQELETPIRIQDVISLGEHALYSICGDSAGIKTFHKKTYFEDKEKKYKWCMVESQSGRTAFNGAL